MGISVVFQYLVSRVTAVKANILNYSAKFQLYTQIFSLILVATNQIQPLGQNSCLVEDYFRKISIKYICI